MRHKIATLTLLLVAATWQQASGQIVQNGSFESPPFPSACATCYYYTPTTVAPWTFQGTSGVISGATTNFNTPSPFPDGNQVAFLQNDGLNDTRFFQDVTLASDGIYRLTYFDAGRTSQTYTGNTSYDIFYGSLLIGNAQTVTGQAFGSHTFDFVAPAGTQRLTFVLDPATPAGDNTAFFDQVQIDAVTATPEPASLTLLATGLVGVFGVARRKRKASAA